MSASHQLRLALTVLALLKPKRHPISQLSGRAMNTGPEESVLVQSERLKAFSWQSDTALSGTGIVIIRSEDAATVPRSHLEVSTLGPKD